MSEPYKPVKRIDLYAWKGDTNHPTDPFIKVHDMNNIEPDKYPYEPEINARELARLIMYSTPGNTVDIFLDAIAKEIKDCNPDISFPYEFIQNHIRIALNQLARIE